MFYVSRNLAALYNLRRNSAKQDISQNFCSASRDGDGFYRSKDPTNSIKVLKVHITF